MSELDEKIREALKSSSESDELFKERTLLAEVVTPFRGKRRWVNTVGLLYGTVANVIAFWAGYRFYHAGEVREQLLWGGLCGVALMFVAFSKVYFWMEMHTNRVLREVKRVELLLVSKSESGADD